MLNILYKQDEFPIFQNRVSDSMNEAIGCPKGNIRLVEDLKTGLIYNADFSQDLMVYDDNYQNEQAVSHFFQKHLDFVASVIGRSIGKNALIEVGCGKGFFLENLLDNGFDVIGFDPTYEGTNPRIKKQYFMPDIVKQAKGLILRHVLEHIQNPVEFLEQLKVSNGGSGKIYIEVPCFDWICKHKAWFDIYYEHVNYFRLNDFKRIFGEIIECGKFFGDQYIYVVAEMSSLKKPKIDSDNRVSFPTDFTDNIINTDENSIGNNQVVIWGGASKGVIFALLKERFGYSVDIVIDINPAKQGRYLPATGLKILSPEDGLKNLERGATIYIMNSNYKDEIISMSNNDFNYMVIDHE